MDKTWIDHERNSKTFGDGVISFLDYAFSNVSSSFEKIKCPCRKCYNVEFQDRKTVQAHMHWNGLDMKYMRGTWHFHKEYKHQRSKEAVTRVENDVNECDDIHGMLHAAFGNPAVDSGSTSDDLPPEQAEHEMPSEEAEKFYKLLKDGEQEVYPGCKKYTKLSCIVRLYHMKCLNGWSDKSMEMLFEFIKDLLPEGEKLPGSFYHAKKIIGDLGLKYNKIDACPNDCMLYWKENVNLSSCPKCQTSRWKTKAKGRNIPAKVLRHFPLIPRLQRYFSCAELASLMKWHAESRTKDGRLRHPADSQAWSSFDNQYPNFALDARNIRLGLATDGFNPFSTMSIAHSTWPVVMMVYNLPPWMCMKQPYLMMTLLIPGPRAPGNDIDVYLEPLIDELKHLWYNGVYTYDASSNQNFVMRASLLWTISDFPAYANLSGWSTKGRYACPYCNKDTVSQRLVHGQKFCYMGHRRFLPMNHRFRREKVTFDNNSERRTSPSCLTGTEVLQQLQGFVNNFGKDVREVCGDKRKRKEKGKGKQACLTESFWNWKKKSIFFELPYWEHLKIRHNLDVMHIEKNICDSLIGTLLDIEGKTKDNLKARLDLKDMGIRPTLHPIVDEGKTYIPPACFTMSSCERSIFCEVLSQVKVPDGYAANISRCVNVKDRKIVGLKSHDHHILMQQLLPLAVRHVLPKNVISVLMELSSFFRELCSKVGTENDYIQLKSRIVLTLCHLEKIFPPAFFDIMVHLTSHLADEAMVAGPVHYRWMYPIERYLHTLKSYVRNRSRPEGSIAEGYLAEECLTFCSRFLSKIETRFNRTTRNNTNFGSEMRQGISIFAGSGHAIGKHEFISLGYEMRAQTHRYVLFNCKEVSSFIEEHLDIIRARNPRRRPIDIEQIHNQEFPGWFQTHVEHLVQIGDERVTEDLLWLARGPRDIAKRFTKYIINGYRFRTKFVDKNNNTQNSGIMVTARTSNFSNDRDANPVAEDLTYYGVLTDIIEIDYYESRKVVLFDAEWVDVMSQGRGMKKDHFGLTIVNLQRLLKTDDTFILASQASQVFFSEDLVDKGWHVVIHTKPRDSFEMNDQLPPSSTDTYLESEPFIHQVLEDIEDVSWIREGVSGMYINTPMPRDPNKCEDEAGDDMLNS